jgi:hypothetical protein
MRRLIFVPLALLALFLVACGGGSGGGSTVEEAAEIAWGKKADALIAGFRKTGAASVTKEAEAAGSPQEAEELLYRGLGKKFAQLATEIEATDAPDACVDDRQTTAETAQKLGEDFAEMGEQGDLTDAEYRALKVSNGKRMAPMLAHFEELELDHC